MKNLKKVWMIGGTVGAAAVAAASVLIISIVRGNEPTGPVTDPTVVTSTTEATVESTEPVKETETTAESKEETTTEETKPAETNTEESKPAETKPEESKPAETKPAETKPAESKPSESKPAESKPAETAPSNGSSSGSSPSGDQVTGDTEGFRSITVKEHAGTVVVTRAGGETLSPYAGLALRDKDAAATGNQGQMLLEVDSAKHLFAAENTSFTLEATGKGSKAKTVIHLENGSVLTRITEKLQEGETYQIQTKNSTLSVRGTVFSVTVYEGNDGNDYTLLQVLEGTVQADLIDPNGNTVASAAFPIGTAGLIKDDVSGSEFVLSDEIDDAYWKGNDDEPIQQRENGNGVPQLVIAPEKLAEQMLPLLEEYAAEDKNLAVTEDTLNNISTTGHDYESAVTKAPTCTEAGVMTLTCKACGDQKTEPVSMIAHTAVKDDAVPATCEETGLTEGSHCSVCKTVLTEQVTVSALGHTAVKDDAVPATCEKTGLTEGSHCSVCEKVLTAQTVVPLAAHTYGNILYVSYMEADNEWEEPSDPLRAEVFCTVCGAAQTTEKAILDEQINLYDEIHAVVSDAGAHIFQDHLNIPDGKTFVIENGVSIDTMMGCLVRGNLEIENGAELNAGMEGFMEVYGSGNVTVSGGLLSEVIVVGTESAREPESAQVIITAEGSYLRNPATGNGSLIVQNENCNITVYGQADAASVEMKAGTLTVGNGALLKTHRGISMYGGSVDIDQGGEVIDTEDEYFLTFSMNGGSLNVSGTFTAGYSRAEGGSILVNETGSLIFTSEKVEYESLSVMGPNQEVMADGCSLTVRGSFSGDLQNYGTTFLDDGSQISGMISNDSNGNLIIENAVLNCRVYNNGIINAKELSNCAIVEDQGVDGLEFSDKYNQYLYYDRTVEMNDEGYYVLDNRELP